MIARRGAAVLIGAAFFVAVVGCGSPATAPQPTQPASGEVGTISTAGPHPCIVQDGRADQHCTPGALNPDVTQDSISRTICVHGWTATIRPSAGYTTALKRQQMPDYGETGPLSAYEEDHQVPLELGGAPRDPRNLWPEPRTGAHPAGEKDRAENAGRAAVCSGRVTLADAQRAILADWTH